MACGDTPYQMLASAAFYREAEEQIASAPSIDLRLGVVVAHDPRRIEGGWEIDTAVGSVRARQVIDTRPPNHRSSGDALLWQSFVGQEIECQVPVFDPTTVELMDFEARGDESIAFSYVLPFSATRALVEYTMFSRRPMSPDSLADGQRAAVARAAHHRSTTVIRQEDGILPMGLRAASPRRSPDYAHVGLMSGAGRSSTGYAFQRLQRWASSAASSLRRHEFDVGHAPDALHQRAMDRLFLRVLRDHPSRAPELFLAMFRDANTSRVIRFLSDRGTALDCAAVIAALPVGLFLAQLLRCGVPQSHVLRGAR